jgi:hypothetical protein
MTESQLRRRTNLSEFSPMTSEGPSSGGLSSVNLVEASPSHHGNILKLHVPLFYTLLPNFIKHLIAAFSFLSFLAPKWKQRYLILIGSFLYKFEDHLSSSPKGTPFPLEAVETDLVFVSPSIIPSRLSYHEDVGLDFAVAKLPVGYEAIFAVSTLRKRHYYAVPSREDASAWIHALRQARQEAITRSLGHGKTPYPRSHEYFDQLARSLVQSKDRIKAKMEASNIRELEMMSFGGEMGGSLRRST